MTLEQAKEQLMTWRKEGFARHLLALNLWNGQTFLLTGAERIDNKDLWTAVEPDGSLSLHQISPTKPDWLPLHEFLDKEEYLQIMKGFAMQPMQVEVKDGYEAKIESNKLMIKKIECPGFMPNSQSDSTSATICLLCGKEKWQHER